MKRITLIICFLYSICFFLPKIASGKCETHAIALDESWLTRNFSWADKDLLVLKAPGHLLKSFLPEYELQDGPRIHPFGDSLTGKKRGEGMQCFGSVVFNEIMANPNGVEGLPESEYIELFNRTDSAITLRNSALFYGGKRYLLPTVTIGAKDFMVLCHQKYKEQWTSHGISVTGVASFPTLLNTGKLLWLEDENSNLISWVEYSDVWYKDSDKKSGGFSLECLDPENLSNEAANWRATNDAKGGTPGAVNSVKKSFPDSQEITVLSSFAQSPDSLTIYFSKPMTISSLSNPDNYRISASGLSVTKVIPDYPCGRNVKLVLNDSLKTGEMLRLELVNLYDASGNNQKNVINVEFLIPEQAEAGDLLFNEILFNPRSGGVCYVGISNVSEKVLSCDQLFLSVSKKDGSRSTPVVLSKFRRVFPPHTELFFTKNASLVAAQYNCETSHGVEVADLPAFPDEKGCLYLSSVRGEPIDEMAYSESMHTTSVTDRRGISLEKKASELLSLDVQNWASASFSSGYGTPGLPNRCAEQTDFNVSADFWIEKNSFSPTNTDNNTLQIHYSLTEEGYVVHIRFFDASGREVYSLPEMSELPAGGMIEWDGKEKNGIFCRVGLYIAYIEMHNAKGSMKKFKLPFALVR